MTQTKPNRRRQLVTPALLRGMGIEPVEVKPLCRDSALLVAGVKLSFAATLKRHLNKSRKRDIIGNFNCSRTDGSPIVKGCSIQVWRTNYERAMSQALAYLEMAAAGFEMSEYFECTDTLPEFDCDLLQIPKGSTYGEAAQEIDKEAINLTLG